MDALKNFSTVLRNARHEKGLSQEALAERLGMNLHSHICLSKKKMQTEKAPHDARPFFFKALLQPCAENDDVLWKNLLCQTGTELAQEIR